MKVSEIFEEEPIQWGLRGDPFLWRELKEAFKDIDMPDTPQELQLLIEKEYEKSTGIQLAIKSISVSRGLEVMVCLVVALALSFGLAVVFHFW